MFSFSKVPLYVLKIFEEKGVNTDDIFILTYCDMDENHNFCDFYVAATKNHLYTLKGREILTKNSKGKGCESSFSLVSFEKYGFVHHSL